MDSIYRDNYNEFLKNNSSFEIDSTTDFEEALESASKKIVIKDKIKVEQAYEKNFSSKFRIYQ